MPHAEAAGRRLVALVVPAVFPLCALLGAELGLERRRGTANGTWSLCAVDDLAVGDSGRFEGWYLTLATDPGYLFTDGFELGSPARWSAAVP